ncbi:hypothetical protein [Caloramator sp. ALD01]|uniref:hypothetical protein n=1 Tax=Caloramator sp. ALD01 TaxID=1031288 RepID=UPI0003FD1ED3|nr:hypothetical protein [Caloramator sp. ALD01]
MIEKIKGKHYLICDVCGDDYEFDSYDKAVKFKRESGWKSIKHSDGWETICEECRKEIEEL